MFLEVAISRPLTNTLEAAVCGLETDLEASTDTEQTQLYTVISISPEGVIEMGTEIKTQNRKKG